jgi:hypothetical protein
MHRLLSRKIVAIFVLWIVSGLVIRLLGELG